jgi:hypothetical protein
MNPLVFTKTTLIKNKIYPPTMVRNFLFITYLLKGIIIHALEIILNQFFHSILLGFQDFGLVRIYEQIKQR